METDLGIILYKLRDEGLQYRIIRDYEDSGYQDEVLMYGYSQFWIDYKDVVDLVKKGTKYELAIRGDYKHTVFVKRLQVCCYLYLASKIPLYQYAFMGGKSFEYLEKLTNPADNINCVVILNPHESLTVAYFEAMGIPYSKLDEEYIDTVLDMNSKVVSLFKVSYGY